MITLTNVGTAYDTASCPASETLGFGQRDFRGFNRLTFAVRHNKIGSGTVSYQLWAFDLNASGQEINGEEITVLNDAGAAGKRYLQTTITISRTDVKFLRVRVKSTNGADDPVYHGGSVLLWVA